MRPFSVFSHRAIVGSLAHLALCAVVATLAAGTLSAQSSSTVAVHDARWQPWLGCWKPTGAIAPTVSAGESIAAPAATMICVVPGKTLTSVDVVNFSGGSITDRTVIEPGQATQKKVDDCTGLETATWSGDGHRLMLKGTFTCGRNVARVETGVMSIDADGQWVQVQSIAVNKNVSTYVAHFRDTGILLEGIASGAIVERPLLDGSGKRMSPPRDGCIGTELVTPSADSSRVTVKSDYTCAGLHRVADAEFVRNSTGQYVRAGGNQVLFGTPSVRAAAGAPVTTTDLLEVARIVDPTTAEAWLSDRGQTFELTGKELVRLADAGMPSRVIDVMVAVSNPKTFALRRNTGDMDDERERRRGDQRVASNSSCSITFDYCYGMTGLGWLYGADRYYGWSPYGYGYGYPYSRYGYGSYGYGGYYGPGYYNGNGPVIIVAPNQPAAPRGRAVYGQGYTREKPITYTPPSTSTSSGSGGASTAGAAGSGSSSSSGSAGAARTAKPRGGE